MGWSLPELRRCQPVPAGARASAVWARATCGIRSARTLRPVPTQVRHRSTNARGPTTPIPFHPDTPRRALSPDTTTVAPPAGAGAMNLSWSGSAHRGSTSGGAATTPANVRLDRAGLAQLRHNLASRPDADFHRVGHQRNSKPGIRVKDAHCGDDLVDARLAEVEPRIG